jgi:ketosteroid isomerase-like protein
VHDVFQTLRFAADLERKRAALMIRGDVDGLAAILADDLYYAHSTGLRDNKSSFIKKFQDGVFVYHKVETHLEAVVWLGEDVFEANGVLILEARVGGVERRMQAIYLVVWRRKDGIWQLVAHQTTILPGSQTSP